jgi:hypothetical protein
MAAGQSGHTHQDSALVLHCIFMDKVTITAERLADEYKPWFAPGPVWVLPK